MTTLTDDTTTLYLMIGGVLMFINVILGIYASNANAHIKFLRKQLDKYREKEPAYVRAARLVLEIGYKNNDEDTLKKAASIIKEYEESLKKDKPYSPPKGWVHTDPYAAASGKYYGEGGDGKIRGEDFKVQGTRSGRFDHDSAEKNE